MASRTRSSAEPVPRFEAAADLPKGGLRRRVARRLSAHAVDDDEEAADGIVVEAVLVGTAQETRVRVAGSTERASYLHGPSVAARCGRPKQHEGEEDQSPEKQGPAPQQDRHRVRMSKLR